MNKTLKVVAHLNMQTEHAAAALSIFKELVEQTRQEEGCIAYILLQNINDASKFTFIEEWVDEQALAKHGNSAHVTLAVEQFAPLLATAPDIQTYFEV